MTLQRKAGWIIIVITVLYAMSGLFQPQGWVLSMSYALTTMALSFVGDRGVRLGS